MTITRVGTLVSTNWLREQLMGVAKGVKGQSASLRVLDTSWLPDKEVNGYKEFYQRGHIPQARYFDLNHCVTSTPLLPRNLPDMNCFTDYVQSLGISADTHVVAYDRLSWRPTVRTWWLFRLFGHSKISMLDGGLQKWEADGFEITTEEPPSVQKTDYKLTFNVDLVRDMGAMKTNVENNTEQVMDARSEEIFVGESPELPTDMLQGHLPKARNIDFSDLFNEDGTFKSNHDLKKLFNAANIDMGKPLVAMCHTGMTACGLAAAAHILGKNKVPVYYGSWNEWAQSMSKDLCITGKR